MWISKTNNIHMKFHACAFFWYKDIWFILQINCLKVQYHPPLEIFQICITYRSLPTTWMVSSHSPSVTWHPLNNFVGNFINIIICKLGRYYRTRHWKVRTLWRLVIILPTLLYLKRITDIVRMSKMTCMPIFRFQSYPSFIFQKLPPSHVTRTFHFRP